MIHRYKTIREARKHRTRNRLKSQGTRARLSVFRSNKHLWVQIIDDERGVTLVAAGDHEVKDDHETLTKKQKAEKVGALVAHKAQQKGISSVMFDRGSYRYHGRVAALADAARKGGLKF